MSALPALRLLDQHSTIIEAVDAGSLLAAAGIPADLDGADALELAEFIVNAAHLKSIADEARGAVSDELVARRDREVSGTLHVGEWTITVPSRTAGTVAYEAEGTAKALDGLVSDDLISPAARLEACPDHRPPAQVPWNTLRLLIDAMEGELGMDEEENLTAFLRDALASEPPPRWVPQPAKLAALSKLGGEVSEAIMACRVPVNQPRRRATVKRATS